MDPLVPPESLTFDYQRHYSLAGSQRPLMMVEFRNVDPVSRRLVGAARLNVLVDSGCDVTMLPDTFASSLGINLASVAVRPMWGIGGRTTCRGKVPLLAELCGAWVSVPVVFYAAPAATGGHHALLGREGAFDAVNLVFLHSARRLLAARA